MPSYLRWVKGVVDSADLPLNVSRELLQEKPRCKAIRRGNTAACCPCWKTWVPQDKLPDTDSADGVTDVLSAEEKAAAEADAGQITPNSMLNLARY